MKYLFSLLLLSFCLQPAAQQAHVIQTKAEKDLIPEGIAIDGRSGKIYLSSINKHKIIVVDKEGNHNDFIKPDQDGFLEGLGLKVDENRGWLWALSVRQEGKQYRSKVHAFDLKTGDTKQQYSIEDTVPHLFNDLVLDQQGNLFISDTYFSSVYRLTPEAQKLELFVQSPLLRYPNGLAFGNQRLYIATYKNGLVMLDTASKAMERVGGLADTTVSHGLDGLVFTDNALIGVYNLGKEQAENCIIQYDLSADGRAVQKEKVIAKGHPLMADPTTLAISKRTIYVIANSHLESYNKNKMTTKGIENALRSPAILCFAVQ